MTTNTLPAHHGSHRRIAAASALVAFFAVVAVTGLPSHAAVAPHAPASGPQATAEVVAGVR
jgi:hypothetical protein